MITIRFDIENLVQDADQKSKEFRDLLDEGFKAAGLQIVKQFQEGQLSGRYGTDIGLNIRTGNLRASIKSLVTTDSDTVNSVISNEGAQYWQYHQDGTDKLKKRLFFDEYFEDEGEKLYESSVDLALQAIA